MISRVTSLGGTEPAHIEVVTPAAEPAITLEFARLQAGREETDTDVDSLLQVYIPAATSLAEAWTGITIVTVEYIAYWDYFPVVLELQNGPNLMVGEVWYTDPAGDPVLLDPTAYSVYNRYDGFAQITAFPGTSWPSTADVPDAVYITFSAGFGPATADVPADIQLAIGMMTTLMLGNRGDCTDSCGTVPCAAMRVLAKYKPLLMR